MRRFLSVIVGVAIVAASLAGCKTEGKAKLTIGIAQIIDHTSLNEIRETFVKTLEERGFDVTYDYQNAQGDQAILQNITQKFKNAKYDLILAIGTPVAQSLANSISSTPVLFAACTDPVSAGLMTDLQKPDKNVTGTSDYISVANIMTLASEIVSDVRVIGAVYNPGEVISNMMIDELKAYGVENGIEVVLRTASTTSEVAQATESIIGKVDALFCPPDNIIAASMAVIAQIANDNAVPTFVGANSMVADGGLATCGVDYIALSKITADMAEKILSGESISNMPVRMIEEKNVFLNTTTAKAIGIEFSDDLLARAFEVYE